MAELFETEYQITPSNLVKGVTWGISFMFIIMIIIIPTITYYFDDDLILALLLFILFLGIMVPTLAGSWAYSPKKYIGTERSIKIVRPVNIIEIPINKMDKVEEKDMNVFKTIRTWGNGGLFSFTGAFYNKTDGKFWMYAKNSNYVMIYTDKKYIVSPDDKELFINQIRSYIKKYGKKK